MGERRIFTDLLHGRYSATRNVGIVTSGTGDQIEPFLGSSFAFQWANYFLSASHVVEGREPDQIGIVIPSRPITFAVRRIIRHPEADVCLLEAEAGSDCDPFNWIGDPQGTVGLTFEAFGYPSDVGMWGDEDKVPKPRLFRGHIQRQMRHQSHMPYRYQAAELNIPAPRGLSGGPAYVWMNTSQGEYPVILGVVAENLKSYTVARPPEVGPYGVPLGTPVEEVVQYGVLVLLAPLFDWLMEHIPADSHELSPPIGLQPPQPPTGDARSIPV